MVKWGGSPSSHVRFPEKAASRASRVGGFNPSSCHMPVIEPLHPISMVGNVVETSRNTEENTND